MQKEYIESVRKQFAYYKMLGEKSFDQVNDEQLFHQMNSESNSISTIVKHLWGNMMSRWTDFLNSDGEKEWRKRDAEFENDIETRQAMLEKWEEGWSCLLNALDQVNSENFNSPVYIRNQEHSIIEAVNRQLAHYAYHVGQIVFLAKIFADSNWESLSIPRGASSAYNQDKFAKPRHKAHFTDEYLKKDE